MAGKMRTIFLCEVKKHRRTIYDPVANTQRCFNVVSNVADVQTTPCACLRILRNIDAVYSDRNALSYF